MEHTMKKMEGEPDVESEFTSKPPSTKVENASPNTTMHDEDPKGFTMVSGPNGNQGGT